MGRSAIEEIETVDAYGVVATYCSGVSSAKVIDGHIFLVWHIDTVGPDGTITKMVNLRTIMPLSANRDARQLVNAAIESSCAGHG